MRVEEAETQLLVENSMDGGVGVYCEAATGEYHRVAARRLLDMRFDAPTQPWSKLVQRDPVNAPNSLPLLMVGQRMYKIVWLYGSVKVDGVAEGVEDV